jgi:hypothetical protein
VTESEVRRKARDVGNLGQVPGKHILRQRFEEVSEVAPLRKQRE